MINKKEKDDPLVVLEDEDGAAFYRTNISGWVSRLGNFYGDDKNSERMARYNGCTHRMCSCGQLIAKEYGYTKCPKCRENIYREIWEKREGKEWDGGPAYSDGFEKFFADYDEFFEWCCEFYSDNGMMPESQSVRLFLTREIFFQELEVEDILERHEFEGSSSPFDLGFIEALKKLNEEIQKQPAYGWEPSKIKAMVDWSALEERVRKEVEKYWK